MKVRGIKTYASSNPKRAGIVILLSNKIGGKSKNWKKRWGRTSYNDESIHQILNYNTYLPIMRASKYKKQILTKLKGEIESNTITLGEINIPLSIVDKTNRQKINMVKENLKKFIGQLNLIDTYRTMHPTMIEYTFLSGMHRTLSTKQDLTNLRRLKSHQVNFSNQSGMKLEFNSKT